MILDKLSKRVVLWLAKLSQKTEISRDDISQVIILWDFFIPLLQIQYYLEFTEGLMDLRILFWKFSRRSELHVNESKFSIHLLKTENGKMVFLKKLCFKQERVILLGFLFW